MVVVSADDGRRGGNSRLVLDHERVQRDIVRQRQLSLACIVVLLALVAVGHYFFTYHLPRTSKLVHSSVKKRYARYEGLQR